MDEAHRRRTSWPDSRDGSSSRPHAIDARDPRKLSPDAMDATRGTSPVVINHVFLYKTTTGKYTHALCYQLSPKRTIRRRG